jgi:hypothetical protein
VNTFPRPELYEREDIRLRPVDGWNQDVFEQLLAVVQRALTEAPPPAEVPFVEPPDDAPKPTINITRILHRAEQDLAASAERVEERARVAEQRGPEAKIRDDAADRRPQLVCPLAEQPDPEAKIREWIATADAKLVAAVRRLLALGARPEVVAEVVAGMLTGKS